MPANPSNNTAATATNLLLSEGLSQTVSGSLSSADLLDFYKFSTTGATNLKLSLSSTGPVPVEGQPVPPNLGDARLTVFQADGITPLAAGIAAGNTSSISNDGKLSESFVFNALPLGNYVIKVDLGTSNGVAATVADYTLEAIANKPVAANSVLWQQPGNASSIFWQLNGPNLAGDAITTPAGYEYVGSADFDGVSDGTGKSQDILWKKNLGNGSYELNVWFMNSDNSLRESKPVVLNASDVSAFAIPDAYKIQRVEDFDGDGKADILFRQTAANSVVLWTMDGPTINLVKSQNYTRFSPAYEIFGTGDFDNNGIRDILFRPSTGEGGLVIWLLDTNLKLIEAPAGQVPGAAQSGFVKLAPNLGGIIPQLGSDWVALGVADFNKTIGGSLTAAGADDKDDLLFVNQISGQLVSWLMNGSEIQAGGFILDGLRISGTSGLYDLVGLGDLNGDQNSDMLWRPKSKDGALVAWQMEGRDLNRAASGPVASSATPLTPFSPGPNLEIITRNGVSGDRSLVDFDGNKRADIYFRETGSGLTILWSMNGKLYEADTTKSSAVKLPNGTAQSVPVSYTPIGGLTAQLSSQAQGTSGATLSTAFNMGSLVGLGNYQDSLAGTASDFYKFKLEKTSDVSIALTAAFGSTTALTTGTYVLSLQTGLNPDGTPTLAVQPALVPGTALAAGTYFLEVKKAAGVAALTPVAYNLKLTGEPSVINLKSIALTNVTGPAGTFAGSIRLADLTAAAPAAKTTVGVNYTITNTEPKTAGSVTVKFYLSRVSTIDPANSKTIVVGTDTITQVLGNGTPTVRNTTVELPAGDNDFWTTDTNPTVQSPVYYYLAYEIDPVARTPQGVPTNQGAIQETFESLPANAATNATDNFNRGLDIDVKQLSIQNTQTPDLLGAALRLTGPATITKGGTISLAYTPQNAGRKATPTGQELNTAFYLYRSDPDTTLPQAQRDNLNVGDGSRTFKLPTADDLTDLNVVVKDLAGLSTGAEKPVNFQLPDANNSFWQGATAGTQYFIGAVYDFGNGIAESIEENNLNQGIGKDRVSVTLT